MSLLWGYLWIKNQTIFPEKELQIFLLQRKWAPISVTTGLDDLKTGKLKHPRAQIIKKWQMGVFLYTFSLQKINLLTGPFMAKNYVFLGNPS